MKWKFWQKQNLQNFRKHIIKVIQKIALKSKDLVLGLLFESEERNKRNLKSVLPGPFLAQDYAYLQDSGFGCMCIAQLSAIREHYL